MKKVLTLFVTMILFNIVNAQMVTSVTATMSSNQIPATATVPVISPLTGAYSIDFTIDIPSTLENANDSLAFANILAAIKDTIDLSYAPDVFGLDTSLNIVGRIYVTSIIRQFDVFTPGDFENQYFPATDIFRCRGRFKWTAN